MLLALLILGACACGHPQAVPSPTESAAPASEAEHKCVVIDAGHQRQGDPKQEPIGPGASETKPCVSDGTSGRFTGSPEYELNLAVALKLQELLEQRGYRVVMTRTDNDVNLSNRARAELAAREGGDIFVRIHANGSEDPAALGGGPRLSHGSDRLRQRASLGNHYHGGDQLEHHSRNDRRDGIHDQRAGGLPPRRR